LPFTGSKAELQPEDREQLEDHLSRCAECGELARADRMFHSRVAKAMLAVTVPSGLREQINTRLAIDRSRVWRKQILKTSAVAAAILVLTVGAVAWWEGRRTTVDPQQIANLQDERIAASPEMVESYFRSKHVPVMMPPGFDPNFLKDRELVEFQGHTVPQLIYQRAEGMAKVYVLKKSHFNVDKEALRQPFMASKCTVEVIDSQEFLFVVVYVGDVQRQHFQNRNQVIG